MAKGPGYHYIDGRAILDGFDVGSGHGISWADHKISIGGSTLYYCEISATNTVVWNGTTYRFVRWEFSGIVPPGLNASGALSQRSENYEATAGSYFYFRAIYESDSPHETYYQIETVPDPISAGTTSGDGIYKSGSSCTISALPISGYLFYRWESNRRNGYIYDSSYTFSVVSDEKWTAHFISASGSILCKSGSGIILFKQENGRVLCAS